MRGFRSRGPQDVSISWPSRAVAAHRRSVLPSDLHRDDLPNGSRRGAAQVPSSRAGRAGVASFKSWDTTAQRHCGVHAFLRRRSGAPGAQQLVTSCTHNAKALNFLSRYPRARLRALAGSGRASRSAPRATKASAECHQLGLVPGWAVAALVHQRALISLGAD